LTDAIKQTQPEMVEGEQIKQKNNMEYRMVQALFRFKEWRRQVNPDIHTMQVRLFFLHYLVSKPERVSFPEGTSQCSCTGQMPRANRSIA
jgi:hypothetical protein